MHSLKQKNNAFSILKSKNFYEKRTPKKAKNSEIEHLF